MSSKQPERNVRDFLKGICSGGKSSGGTGPLFSKASTGTVNAGKRTIEVILQAKKPKLGKERKLAKKAGGSPDDGTALATEMYRALQKKQTKKDRPNSNSKKGQERRLNEGETPEGLQGPQQPTVVPQKGD